MKFKANDIVSYSDYGICKVEGVVKRASLTDDTKAEYYELRPVDNHDSKIFIPVNNETLVSKIDKVLSSKEIKELIQQAVTEGLIWTDDKAERQVQYRAILDRGDRTELIRLVRTLDLRQREAKADNKKLLPADNDIFKKAKKVLQEEISYVLKIKKDEAIALVLEEN